MDSREAFVRLHQAYVFAHCPGTIGGFVDACARHFDRDAKKLENHELVEHAECYARKLTESER